MLDLTLRFIASLIAHAGLATFVYALFRVPIKKNHIQITSLTLIMGVVHFYTRFGLNSKLFFPATVVALLLGLMILRRYPFWYAFIISSSGYFLGMVIDEIITFSLMSGLGIPMDEFIKSSFYYVMTNIAASIVLFIVSALLVKLKWGFTFIYKRFGNTKWILKTHNFVWAFLLVLTLIVIQFSISNLYTFSFHWIFLFALLVIFGASLMVAYKENLKVRKDLERIEKKETDKFEIY